MLGDHVGAITEWLKIADWLTVAEVARKLTISNEHARRLVVRDQFTAVKTHLGWLIDPTSVEAYKPKRKPRKAA